jgi:hypothetical protein
MRTTITLENDVAERLRDLAHERGLSFKAVVNLVLRRGLAEPAPVARPFQVKATDMGLLPGIDLDKALSLAAQLEDEETIRKLERRK